jgi:hypothetical protein
MPTVNTAKIVTGGLLAGLVFNVLDFVVNGLLMNAELQANMTRLGLDPAAMESGAGMAAWIVIDFLLGIVVVFTYAAIRPRFGPGPKTAVIAGLLMYIPVTLVMYGLTTGGVMTMALFGKMTAFSLVTTVVGSIAGAWAYKEA